ncbi:MULTISPECIES: hypothetical protein [Proteus]|uniref:hypothetical protein n=1 Tax=Proteus TaxID=583 RepID=UPI000C1F53D5|nr:hypothetical protein [Proteus columbae]
MKNEFLLTYSVKDMGKKTSDTDANTVRYYIESYLSNDVDFDDVNKLKNVETTITGMITVTGSIEIDKKTNIIKIIRRVFKKLMDEYDIKDTSIEIDCAILVHGIKKAIVFKV